MAMLLFAAFGLSVGEADDPLSTGTAADDVDAVIELTDELVVEVVEEVREVTLEVVVIVDALGEVDVLIVALEDDVLTVVGFAEVAAVLVEVEIPAPVVDIEEVELDVVVIALVEKVVVLALEVVTETALDVEIAVLKLELEVTATDVIRLEEVLVLVLVLLELVQAGLLQQPQLGRLDAKLFAEHCVQLAFIQKLVKSKDKPTLLSNKVVSK